MKKILSVLFSVLLAAQAWAANYDFMVQSQNGQNLFYSITNATNLTVMLVSENSSTTVGTPYYYGSNIPTGNVVIPQTVKNPNDNKTYTVKSIASSTFAYCSDITSLTIPASITEIPSTTTWLNDCSSLTTITVATDNPNYSSQNGVLYNKDKTALLLCPRGKTGAYTIPNTVTSISERAFYQCGGLTSVTFATPSLVASIGDYAFYQCTNLSTISIPNTVTSIGARALYQCSGLTSVTFATPSSVTNIGDYAFYKCTNLSTITIPNSVASIGEGVFSVCTSLTSINVESNNTTYTSENGILFNKAKTELICYPAGKTGSYSIPSSVSSIGSRAFHSCSGLTSVTIPNSITNIGERAFYDCSGITSITIPNSVTSIGVYAFYQCSGLTSVTFATPTSVTNISDYMFYGCSGLTSITIPNTVTSIGNYAFQNCSGLTSVSIPNSVTSIGNYAFRNCTNLNSVSIPNTVTSFGLNVFDGCSSLNYNTTYGNCKYLGNSDNPYVVLIKATGTDITSCTIHENCKIINSSAFNGCSSLASITIPNSVTSIGSSAFYGCSSLASITIPNLVTSIGSSAFYNCSNLKSINIPNGVTSIGNYAFYNCTALTTVTFATPSSVTSIGYDAFYQCSKLKSITIPNLVTSIGSSTFRGCSSMETFSFASPSSVTKIDNGAFYECSSLTSITIPNSVTSIGIYVFSKCTNMTSISVEDGNPAFTSENGVLFNKDKTKLVCYPDGKTETAYKIPNSVTSIGGYAFAYCSSSLTTVSIPNSVTDLESYAFDECSGLRTITIPNSVTSMNYYAIRDCGNLTLYCQAEFRPQGWSTSWNFSNRPVKWGCKVVSVETNNEEYGTVSASGTNIAATGSDGSLWYLSETTNGTASLTAEPAEHYAFLNWNDGNTANPRNFTVTESKNYTANFARMHTVTVNAEHGTVTGDGEYTTGSTATLTVNPSTGYTFVGWADNNNAPNPRTVTVTGNMAFTAIIEPIIYNITANASDGGTVSGGGSYAYGTTATLTATPANHYYFDYWNDNNSVVNPRTVDVTGNAEYTATFTYGVLINAYGENGTVEGKGTYRPGTIVSLKAIPNRGYYFDHWDIDDGIEDNPYNVQAPAPTNDLERITFVAVFYPGKTITVNTEHGTIDGAGGHRPGSTVTLTAIPDEGYHFVSWGDGELSATREVTVDDDIELSATFEINTYTVTVTANNGSVTGGGTYTHGQTATLTATPQNNHYYFVGWSNGSTVNPLDTTITGNVVITATFAEGFILTLNAGIGSISGAESGTYAAGSVFNIEAVAEEGRQFIKWSDDVTTASRTITLTADTTISAIFEYYTYTVTKKSGIRNGNITISGHANEDGTYNWGTSVKLTAKPSSGYHFVKWSDNKKNNPRSISVTENIEISAVFEEHTIVTDKAVDPTCTINGKTKGSHCEVCEEVIEEQTSIPALGHDFGEYVYNNDATTYADGTETATCQREGCDETDTRVAEGTKLSATAVSESAAALNIYAHGNTIIIENATEDILVYDAMGKLVGKDVARNISAITVNGTGIYIVKTGGMVKRVMVN
ncbi:MAG: leucine-rich repeat protein [Salinivirgaceae bacterium]|nr:leucine-rich repeat protein [Salinivirgaceae bacterium]